MGTMFERKTILCKSRNPQEFLTQKNRTAIYGLESFSNCLPLIPDEYRQINSLKQIKSNFVFTLIALADYIIKICAKPRIFVRY